VPLVTIGICSRNLNHMELNFFSHRLELELDKKKLIHINSMVKLIG
jgi:hypothetical protein